jgi:murein L,D-transpeptidase YcbB/YkuD
MQTAIASGKTLHINLRRQMPVHIVYSMSRVNEAGRVELRPDVYGRNRQSRPVEEDAGVPAEALTDDGQRDTGP